MKRTIKHAVALLFVSGLVIGLELPSEAGAAASGKPNIILINVDDMGYGDLSITGSTHIKTPNIDGLAAEGVLLTNFFSSSPVCTPSRAGLLTGRYPVRTGLANSVIFPGDTHGLPADEITIAEVLKEQGYATLAIGKWHLGHYQAFWPTNQGFDEFYGVPYSNDMKPFPLYRGKDVIEDEADQSQLTGGYTRAATSFIRKHKEKAFFVYFAHTFPHIPLYASDRFKGKSLGGLYGDTIEEIDWSVGELLKALKDMDLEEETLVLFTSDNGPWFEGSSGARRGRKSSTLEGGMHVPFIARWPGKIPAGITSDAISMNIDIFPTLTELAGGAIPSDRKIDGKNIWPLFLGSDQSPHEKLYFFIESFIGAIRTQNWKLRVRTSSPMAGALAFRGLFGSKAGEKVLEILNTFHTVGPWDQFNYWLLHNLKDDPNERYSVARMHPEKLDQMKQYLEEGRREFSPLAKENHIPNVMKKGRPDPEKDPLDEGWPMGVKILIVGVLVLMGLGIVLFFAAKGVLGLFRRKGSS